MKPRTAASTSPGTPKWAARSLSQDTRYERATIAITLLGGSASKSVYIPSYPSAPVHQTFGVYDGYQGSVDVGLPTSTAPQGCFFALAEDDVRGRIIITGYLVDPS